MILTKPFTFWKWKHIYFENESSFRNPFWKWKHVFSLSCQCVKMNAPSERISAYCDLCHHVDDDPHHHWCRKLLRHTQSWWQVFSRDQTRVVWNCQTTSLESYHFTLLTDANFIYLPMPNSFAAWNLAQATNFVRLSHLTKLIHSNWVAKYTLHGFVSITWIAWKMYNHIDKVFKF